MTANSLEVREHMPVPCSTKNCDNASGGGRMVTVRWKRQPKLPSSGLMNELELCMPCWGTLFDEITDLA